MEDRRYVPTLTLVFAEVSTHAACIEFASSCPSVACTCLDML